MRSKILLLFLLFCLTNLSAQDCDQTETQVIFSFTTDDYAYESSWMMIGANGITYSVEPAGMVNVTTYIDTICVPTDMCLTLTIDDTAGDGTCCGFGLGHYELFVDGVLTIEGGEFGGSITHNLNCPIGTTCENPLTAALGINTANVTFNSQWYIFTTDSTGLYNISTCDLNNTCNTTIWVYDNCNGLDWDNTNVATYAFNDDFCDEQAEVSIAVGAGETYYIRIGSASEECDSQSVQWNLEYAGPVIGCMDPTACNYNPLASVDDGSCMFAGDPNCPDGPDLLMREDVFLSSLYIDYIENTDGCLIEESCLSGYGTRELLRFSTHIDNIGESDYYIGVPELGNDQFEFDACHGHWHYEGYANYLIFDSNGNALPQGFKNGFCVLDLTCDWGTPQYGCGNMGISAGCGDIYGAYLDCQWFDITELPEGDYTFAVAVNWDHDPDKLGHYESDYNNNWAQACLRITRSDITGQASFEILDDCEPYVDCAGVAYGTAALDCAGECNGSSLMGDINADGLRSAEDINLYLSESFANSVGSVCNDLNADGQISVTDLVLAMECMLSQGQPVDPEHNHDPCDFPFNIFNQMDMVFLGIGELNMDEGWFEVTIQNPFNKIAGFEFSIEGAIISSVTTMLVDWNHELHHDDTDIIGFSWEEEFLSKEQNLRTLARVYYSELTGDEICIGQITATVNDMHEETANEATTCADVISGVYTIRQNDYHAVAFPNPTMKDFTILFDYYAGQQVNITVSDMTGRLVFNQENWTKQQIELRDLNWAGGIYTYRIEGERGVSVGKIVME